MPAATSSGGSDSGGAPPTPPVRRQSASSNDDNEVALQVFIPELTLQKCFNVSKDAIIWNIKQQVISSLPKELKEPFNYGLYCPPQNGKAGKFLDEERPISDYPFQDTVGYLELRYKRRVYKMMNVDEKHIKQLHTRANLRRLLDHVSSANVDKIIKLCTRGLDPNFHCPETGETPLTIAAGQKHCNKVIIALVNGGALLDFRTKDGRTALHRAIEKNNMEALKTLLDLGASPNYKDSRGLTPLYYTLLYSTDAQMSEVLLHDRAVIGASDPQGWQEVHQACKHGLVQHLEHLLYYGADMNARNASGNTSLHVCAVNDQEQCARVLLFRGADKTALNYANQNPYQVAVIAGNLKLAEIINNHRSEDCVPYRDPPMYNPRRRASSHHQHQSLSGTHSDPRLELIMGGGGKPPSPCPSNRSLPPLSSCSSSLSEGSGAPHTMERSGTSDTSSGVCSGGGGMASDSGAEDTTTTSDEQVITVGTTCVCVAPHRSQAPDHLNLLCGDVVEVTKVIDGVMLEGRNRDSKVGLFPIQCVQEVRLRDKTHRHQQHQRATSQPPKSEQQPRKPTKVCFSEPKTVILHKGRKGFGFVLRGAKATSPLLERHQSDQPWPSLQYLDDVDKGGVADMVGLRKGDFLMEINGQDVSKASHETVVQIIRQSGDLVAMTVVSPVTSPPHPQHRPSDTMTASMHHHGEQTTAEKQQMLYRQCATLPRKLSAKRAPTPPKRDPKTTLSVGRARARQLTSDIMDPSQDGDSQMQQSAHFASIRARPNSRRLSSAELEDFFNRQDQSNGSGDQRRCATIARMPKIYGSVAAMKRQAADVKVDKTAQGGSGSTGTLHKDFNSEPDLQSAGGANGHHRSRSQEDINAALNAKNDTLTEASTKPARIYAETLPLRGKKAKVTQVGVAAGPPPEHPPPPPPSEDAPPPKLKGDYARPVAAENGANGLMSSFRPGDNAKTYAAPGSQSGSQTGSTGGYKTPSECGSTNKSRNSGPEKTPYSTFRAQESTDSTDSLKKAINDLPEPPSDLPYIPEPDYDQSSDEDNATTRSSATPVPHQKGTQRQTRSLIEERPLPSPPLPPPPPPIHESKVQNNTTGRGSSIQNQPLPKPPHEATIGTTVLHIRHDDDQKKLVLEMPGSRTSVSSVRENISAFEKRSSSVNKDDEEKPRPPSMDEGLLQRQQIAAMAAMRRSTSKTPPTHAPPPHHIHQPTPISAAKLQQLQHEQQLRHQHQQQHSQQPRQPTMQQQQQIEQRQREQELRQQQLAQLQQQHQLELRQQEMRQQAERQQQQRQQQLLAQQQELRQREQELRFQQQLQQQRQQQQLQQQQQRLQQQQAAAQQQAQMRRALTAAQQQQQNPAAIMSQSLDRQTAASLLLAGGTIPKKTLKIRLDEKVQATRRQDSAANRTHSLERAIGSLTDTDIKRSIDESLQYIRLQSQLNRHHAQVDNLGLAAVNEVDVLSDLVPPPPEFNAAQAAAAGTSTPEPVPPPPPEFSDDGTRRYVHPGSAPIGGSGHVAPHSLQQHQHMRSLSASVQGTRSVSPADLRHLHHHLQHQQMHAPQPHPHQGMTPAQLYQQYEAYRRLNGSNTLPHNFTGGGTLRATPTQQRQWDTLAGAYRAQGGQPHTSYGTLSARMMQQHMHSQQHSVVPVERQDLARLRMVQREFRQKTLIEWTQRDVCDWLESLFLQEYKPRFIEAGITGEKLAHMDQNDFIGLGVKQTGHRVNMERSLKRYVK